MNDIGVGPWVGDWPDDERLDPHLLDDGFIRTPIAFNATGGIRRREELDEDFNFELQPGGAPSLTQLWLAVVNSGRIRRSELLQQWTNNSVYTNVLNCEIIPCDQKGAIRTFMSQLQALRREDIDRRRRGLNGLRIRVEVTGTLTWDGTHSRFPGHLEIHPVKQAQVVAVVRP